MHPQRHLLKAVTACALVLFRVTHGLVQILNTRNSHVEENAAIHHRFLLAQVCRVLAINRHNISVPFCHPPGKFFQLVIVLLSYIDTLVLIATKVIHIWQGRRPRDAVDCGRERSSPPARDPCVGVPRARHTCISEQNSD
jgi:hypothetical protein